jgi:hypothetical protein
LSRIKVPSERCSCPSFWPPPLGRRKDRRAPEGVLDSDAGVGQRLPVGEALVNTPVDRLLRKPAAASNRVRLITVGKTAYGKMWTAVPISPGEPRAPDKIRETT